MRLRSSTLQDRWETSAFAIRHVELSSWPPTGWIQYLELQAFHWNPRVYHCLLGHIAPVIWDGADDQGQDSQPPCKSRHDLWLHISTKLTLHFSGSGWSTSRCSRKQEWSQARSPPSLSWRGPTISRGGQLCLHRSQCFPWFQCCKGLRSHDWRSREVAESITAYWKQQVCFDVIRDIYFDACFFVFSFFFFACQGCKCKLSISKPTFNPGTTVKPPWYIFLIFGPSEHSMSLAHRCVNHFGIMYTYCAAPCLAWFLTNFRYDRKQILLAGFVPLTFLFDLCLCLFPTVGGSLGVCLSHE